MQKYVLENRFLDNSYLLGENDGSIKPTAGVFLEIAEDGTAKIKNSNSNFQDVDISNNPAANYTHDLIINGTTSIKIKGKGGEAVNIESTILTAPQLAEINNLIGGEMDSLNGYTINLYLLIYKLILWEYINASYIITLKPFVIYENVTNVNDATTQLNYEIPTTKITANKTSFTLKTDCLAILWSDGTVINNEGTETTQTGPGQGDLYLIGDYTKLVSSNQNISSIDKFSDDLIELDLNRNMGLNIQNSYFDNIANLEILNLGGCNNTKVDSILSKYNLTYLNLYSTLCSVNNISNHTNLTYLQLDSTESNITDISNNVNLTFLRLISTESKITDISSNVNLISLLLGSTNSDITDISNNVNLEFLLLQISDCEITDISNNTNLKNVYLYNTESNITDISNNVNLEILQIQGTESEITDISNNTNLKWLNLHDTQSKITDVSNNNLLVSMVLTYTNNTAQDNNSIVQDLINTTRAGSKNLSFDSNAAINQTNVNILVSRGWDVTQS